MLSPEERQELGKDPVFKNLILLVLYRICIQPFVGSFYSNVAEPVAGKNNGLRIMVKKFRLRILVEAIIN